MVDLELGGYIRNQLRNWETKCSNLGEAISWEIWTQNSSISMNLVFYIEKVTFPQKIFDFLCEWMLIMFFYLIDSTELERIAGAFAEYREKTCISFVERTLEPNYIYIRKTGGG